MSVLHALVASAVLIGCGRSDRGYVQGNVTLDGAPLPLATVEFQPERGSPSFGETNEAGNYELALSAEEKGAFVGTHTIRVSTFRVEPKPDGTRETIPEKVPSAYNTDSTLIREVKSGKQTINIEMVSTE